MAWSAAQYVKFEDERTRPARDLLAQVPDLPPGPLYDLGCGPGNSTALLAARFAGRDLTGIDSDDDMLAAARTRLPDTAFEKGDLRTWRPKTDAALLYANAVLQWMPDPQATIERLMGLLVSGGVLAVQMPDNMDEPSHGAMRSVAADSRFATAYAGTAPARRRIPSPAALIDRLSPMAARIDVWHTVYNHRLDGPEAIVEWVKGTGLRPYLDPLNDNLRADYLSAYLDRIRLDYPPLGDGRVLLRFPRLFLLVVKA